MPRRPRFSVVRLAIVVAAAAVVGAGCGSETSPVPVVQVGGVLGPWQPRPFALTDRVGAGALAACKESSMVPAGGELRLVDVRGGARITFIFTAAPNTVASCDVLASSDGTYSMTGGSGSSSAQPPAVLAPAELLVVSASPEGGGTLNGLTAPGRMGVYGRAGSQVAAVEFVVAGQPIMATTGNGLFAAWWPSDARWTQMTAIGADGQPLPGR